MEFFVTLLFDLSPFLISSNLLHSITSPLHTTSFRLFFKIKTTIIIISSLISLVGGGGNNNKKNPSSSLSFQKHSKKKKENLMVQSSLPPKQQQHYLPSISSRRRRKIFPIMKLLELLVVVVVVVVAGSSSVHSFPYSNYATTTTTTTTVRVSSYRSRIVSNLSFRGGGEGRQQQPQTTVHHGTPIRTTANISPLAATTTSTSSGTNTNTPGGGAWNVSSYHLLWSPGFRKHLGIAIMGLTLWRLLIGLPLLLPEGGGEIQAATIFTSTTTSITMFMTKLMNHPFISNIVLPLLSSACCIVQVFINILVGTSGCAGFNTYLGPIRPYFITLFLYLTVTTTMTSLSSSPPRFVGRVILTTSIRCIIAFLPELLHIWNQQRQRSSSTTGNTGTSTTTSLHHHHPVVATLEFEIPTMGCVACINKIDSSLRQTNTTTTTAMTTNTNTASSSSSSSRIETARVWLLEESSNQSSKKKGGGGRARVELSGITSQEELDLIAQSMIQSIEGAGFGRGCQVIDSTLHHQ